MAPSHENQRQQFEEWFDSPQHQAYLAAVGERGGTPLDDPEQAFELYRRRWTQPQPPEGLSVPDIRTADREITRRWLREGWTYPSTDVDQRPDAWFAPKPQPDYLGDLTA